MSGRTRGEARRGGAGRGGAMRLGAAAGTAAITAALALPGGIAYANPAPPPANQGNTSVASGNQALLPLRLPLTMYGISAAALGNARSGCTGGSTIGYPPGNPGGPMIPGRNPPSGNPPGKHHKPPKGHHKCHNHHKHHGRHGGGTSHGGSHGGESHGGFRNGPSTGGSSQYATDSTVRTTSRASLASGTLPATGTDLLGILTTALGCVGAGAGALFARCRRARAREDAQED